MDVRRLGWHLGGAVTAANVVAAVAVFAFLALALEAPLSEPECACWSSDVALFVGTVVVLAVAANLMGARLCRPVEQWLREDRPPTDRERRATLAQPAWQAMNALAVWGIALVVYPLGSVLFFDHSVAHALRVADGIFFGALMAAGLTYLIVERVLRPVYARVLAGRSSGVPSPGVQRRLLLVWALGSGVPLLGVVVAPTVVEAADWKRPMMVLGVSGLGAGVVMTGFAAHAVAVRLAGLRSALAAVETGALDVRGEVDDPGEVGELQVGFNRMVDGLRERRRLHDLFGRQVGEQVAQIALERGADLGGEQQEAAVLFVDLVGSTALALDRPPREVVDTLNRFFEIVVGVVNDAGGYVSRFEGDAAVCVFGAPVVSPDCAAQALRAARLLVEQLAEVDLDAGVGVSAGTVVAGNVGTKERYEYTVIGDPVNEAARLTELAKTHERRAIASDAAVARADVEALNWGAAAEVVLRGRTRPTLTYVPADVVVSLPR